MKNRRLTDPALIIAIIALVFALGGSAIAAKRYLITNAKQISPAALKQLEKLASGKAGPAGANGANGVSGKNGSNGSPGERGAAGPGATVYWAVVDEKGEVKRHGTTDATSERIATGTYVIDFGTDVSQCAYEAAIGRWESKDTEDPGFATVVGRNENPNAVLVQTYNASAEKADEGVDKNFHLAVYC
jgi:hypothetical protein